MAFFDSIGKQISNVTQNVAQQTKNLADITQLNSAISDRQDKIQRLYLTLGQAYYERHKEEPDAEESALIQKINGLFQEISQYRDKIVQIRGNGVCPGCGKEIPASAQFCNYCGSRIEKTVPPQTIAEESRCPQCGSVNPEGNLYCNHCGNRL